MCICVWWGTTNILWLMRSKSLSKRVIFLAHPPLSYLHVWRCYFWCQQYQPMWSLRTVFALQHLRQPTEMVFDGLYWLCIYCFDSSCYVKPGSSWLYCLNICYLLLKQTLLVWAQFKSVFLNLGHFRLPLSRTFGYSLTSRGRPHTAPVPRPLRLQQQSVRARWGRSACDALRLAGKQEKQMTAVVEAAGWLQIQACCGCRDTADTGT